MRFRLAALAALTLIPFAAAPARATVIHFGSPWRTPQAYFADSAGKWKATPMKAETGGWYAADTGTVSAAQVVFTDGAGNWDNAQGGGNYTNDLAAGEVWVANSTLSYAPPESGTFVAANVPSRILGASRHVRIYLPAWYGRRTSQRYCVLYLQDGQNLFDPNAFWGGWAADQAADSSAQDGHAQQIIIVGIDNSAARMDEYTQVRDASERAGGTADRYLDFIQKELKPWVDARYRTKADAASTAIGGSSLGGLLALYAGLTRPAVFGKVLAMSPSLWWGNENLIYKVTAMRAAPGIDVYLDSGGAQDGSADVFTMRDLLHSKGLKYGSTLWHWYEPADEHNELAWRGRLPRALGDLFPR